MTELCPRSCCWLFTAGIFILLGAIQLTAGLVLLKSKYVFLLAGPDFWTAAGNVVTGFLLGLAASVWKNPRKRLSQRNVARENLILALLISSVFLNATTSAILIMGEGNTMLTIDVETRLAEDYNLGSEILRIAYATSVVCPVVCLVVAAMAVTEGCCNDKSRNAALRTPIKQRRKRSFLKVTPKRYDWVFDAERDLTGDPSIKKLQSSASSSPSSSAFDDVTGRYHPVQSTPTVEELQNSLARMCHSRISGRQPQEDSLDQTTSPASLAGEMVAIQIRRERTDPNNSVPVEHPFTEASGILHAGESCVDAAPTRIRIIIPEDASSKLKRTKFSSFKAVENSSPRKKNHKGSRSPALESIIEVPSTEDAKVPSPSLTSGYGSSPEANSSISKEASSIQDTPKEIVVPTAEMATTPRKARRGTIPKELYANTGLFHQERTFAGTQEPV